MITKEISFKDDGLINYVLRINDEDLSHLMEFECFECCTWRDKKYCEEDLELILTGFIKWDGCSHVTFGRDQDGYLHLCGKNDWDMFSKLMTEIYKIASETIVSYDKRIAE